MKRTITRDEAISMAEALAEMASPRGRRDHATISAVLQAVGHWMWEARLDDPLVERLNHHIGIKAYDAVLNRHRRLNDGEVVCRGMSRKWHPHIAKLVDGSQTRMQPHNVTREYFCCRDSEEVPPGYREEFDRLTRLADRRANQDPVDPVSRVFGGGAPGMGKRR